MLVECVNSSNTGAACIYALIILHRDVKIVAGVLFEITVHVSRQYLQCLSAGKYVEITDTIKGFQGIMEGKHDDLPEMAFYMVGDIKEVQEKADKMAKDMAESNR